MKKITFLMLAMIGLFIGNQANAQSYFIDYDGYDESSASGSYERFIWNVNTSADAGFGNMRWVTVDFSEMIVSEDGTSFTTLPSGGNYTFTLDSVDIYYNYAANGGDNDVEISIFDFNDLGPRLGGGPLDEVADPRTGAALYTENFDTSDLVSSAGLEVLTMYPNLSMNGGDQFSVYVQNTSDTLDAFSLLAGYDEACGTGELAEISPVAYNSAAYMAYGGSPDFLNPLLYNWGAGFTCNQYYVQNFVIVPYITATFNDFIVEASSPQLTTQTCPGTQFGLSTSAVGGSDNYTYSWSPATGLDNPALANPTVTVGDADVEYIVTVTDVDNSETLMDTLTVFSWGVTVDAGADVTVLCGAATSVTATATTSGSASIASITWDNGDDVTLVTTTGGTYTVMATNDLGCTASDDVVVTVSGFNSVDFTQPALLCSGTALTFENNSTSSTGWNFSWDLMESGTSIITASGEMFTFQFPAAGVYTLELTADSSGCEYSESKTLTILDGTQSPCVTTPPPTSIDEVAFAQAMNLYPNPATTALTVSFELKNTADVEVSIFTLTGQTIEARTLENTTNVVESFNVANLNSGVYIIRVKTEEGISTQRFVVSK
ncbi:MAG: T9SS type A sorting domain-containing protein [Chitinophagales bacterium]